MCSAVKAYARPITTYSPSVSGDLGLYNPYRNYGRMCRLALDNFMEEQKRKFKQLLSNNAWDYDPDNLVVTHLVGGRPGGTPYEIPLDKMPDSAAVLDLIAQVAQKEWVTPRIVGDLVLLLDAVLGLQGNYCGGASRPGGPRGLPLPPLPE